MVTAVQIFFVLVRVGLQNVVPGKERLIITRLIYEILYDSQPIQHAVA
jgi:hypothetical protein